MCVPSASLVCDNGPARRRRVEGQQWRAHSVEFFGRIVDAHPMQVEPADPGALARGDSQPDAVDRRADAGVERARHLDRRRARFRHPRCGEGVEGGRSGRPGRLHLAGADAEHDIHMDRGRAARQRHVRRRRLGQAGLLRRVKSERRLAGSRVEDVQQPGQALAQRLRPDRARGRRRQSAAWFRWSRR